MEIPRLLIVLDLDETLIRATGNPTLDPPDFTIDSYRVRRRPMVHEFLCAAATFADLGIWSSASESYVDAIVRKIVPDSISLQFVWARSRCTRQYDSEQMEEYWVKDLKKVRRLGYPLERVLMVDDSPEKVERHFGNYVRVEPFYGDQNDRVLPDLERYLRSFISVPNVRTVEKRGWQHDQNQIESNRVGGGN
ncbi:HAD family hydrolase [Actomonas aquatica]|uniref:HAD family hydrolase n=1 Tax=Actomonas aquatica TaxID=2866162 RepID=A0ABZ1CBU1_9BACT|nr:HAD family hydrolase [Opitutus sp. WL0086]WRQ89044.1 HAD family hydrolase [Opitutus sp. WL0086]